MTTASETAPSEIPSDVVARWRKLRAMAAAESASETERKTANRLAEKIEAKWPNIGRRIEYEDTYQRMYDDLRAKGVPRPEDIDEPDSDSIMDMLRRSTARIFGEDPFKWAAGMLERAVQAQVRYIAEHGEDIEWEEFMGKFLTLAEELAETVDIEVVDEEDEDGEWVTVTASFPARVVDRLQVEPRASATLGAFLIRMMVEED